MNKDTEQKTKALETFWTDNPRIALAFSGGTDSAFLLWAAATAGADVKPYYVKTAFQPEFELKDAKKLVNAINRLLGEKRLKLNIIEYDILACREVLMNTDERCYYCKRHMMESIKAELERRTPAKAAVGAAKQVEKKEAAAAGAYLLIDGTNASDPAGDRPGMRASAELGVRSPLRELGFTKSEIRELSKDAGLFTADKPAYACLATRIPTNNLITADRLALTETAENYLASLGFSDFRVRMFGDSALIQVTEEQQPKLRKNKEKIFKEFAKLYSSVIIDGEPRRGE